MTLSMLASDDPDFGGFRYLFEDFYEDIRSKLELLIPNAEQTLIEDYISRISEYVMTKLHSTIWSRDRKIHASDKSYSSRI